MSLLKNIKKTEYGVDAESRINLFDSDISVSMESVEDADFAEECLLYINSLSEEVLTELCEASIRYCNVFLHAVGEPIINFSSPSEVLKLIYPSVLIVPKRHQIYSRVIHIEFNCDWEEEHGMEWLVRDDEVLYVGAFHGQQEWRERSEYKARWNFA